jgi:hypothetical protein
VLGVIGILRQTIYKQMNKKGANTTRLACQTKSIVYEKVFKPELFKNMQNSIKAGNFSLNTTILKSQYMESHLFEYVDKEKVQEDFLNKLLVLKDSTHSNEKSSIELTIYENDKLDPGKKTPKSKLYAGYLIFEFKFGSELVYKIQVDFMNLEGKDIDEKLSCAIESLMSL